MSAAIGAGVGLGGLLLIFSGLLFGQAALLRDRDARQSTINKIKSYARLGLVPFAAALAVAALAASYFIAESASVAAIAFDTFIVLIVVTIFYGIAATKFL